MKYLAYALTALITVVSAIIGIFKAGRGYQIGEDNINLIKNVGISKDVQKDTNNVNIDNIDNELLRELKDDK